MRKFLVLFLLISSFFFLALKPVVAGTWTHNTILTPPINEYYQQPNMTLDSNNYGRVVYLIQDLINPRIGYLQCTNIACTTFNSGDTEIPSIGRFAIIQGADNFSRILHDNMDSNLSLITCTNILCTTSSQTVVSSLPNVGFNQMRYGQDGFLRIALVSDTGTYQTEYIQCQNELCTAKISTTLSTDSSIDLAFDIGTDGYAQFIYVDNSNGGLFYAKCNNDSCSDKTTTLLESIDFEIDYVSAISLDVGSNNYARISYLLGNSNQFKFVQCTDQNCSTRNSNLILGTTASSNFRLSLSNGDLAKITYVDLLSKLNYLSCADQACSDYVSVLIEENPIYIDSGINTFGYGLNSNNSGRLIYNPSSWSLSFAYEAPDPTPTSIPTATPTPTLGPPGPQASILGSTTNTPTCNDRYLNETPDLFQIATSKTTATLYFSPISDIRKYYVSYGTTEGAEQYGAEFEYGDPSGVLSYAVNMLSPNQTYYFKVRGGRGCKAGAWGNVMKAKTTSGNAKQVFYKNIFSQIFTTLTNSTANAQTNKVLGASTKPKSCSYVVESGDSLWSIAQSAYSNGDLYTKLMKLNNLKDTTIHPGQKLKAC